MYTHYYVSGAGEQEAHYTEYPSEKGKISCKHGMKHIGKILLLYNQSWILNFDVEHMKGCFAEQHNATHSM